MSKELKLAAVAILFVASPGFAQEADIVVTSDYLRMSWEKVSGEVPFGDLNLTTDKGVETFQNRVKAEARKLCGMNDRSLVGKTNQNICYDSVLASAKPQIDKLSATARAR